MKKSFRTFFDFSWTQILLLGVLLLIFFQSVLLLSHQFLVYQYHKITYQIAYTQFPHEPDGVEAPQNWLRSIFTRPDILLQEVRFLYASFSASQQEYQHRGTQYRDRISQNIDYLWQVAQRGEAISFAGVEDTERYARRFHNELIDATPGDLPTLFDISTASDTVVAKIQQDMDFTERRLVLQDILAFEREMYFITDIYRMEDEKSEFDIRAFWRDFSSLFSEKTLRDTPVSELRNAYQDLVSQSTEYREHGQVLRAEAYQDSQALISQYSSLPPDLRISPLPGVYSLIFISLAEQMLYAYQDGELILATPITSGRNDYETVRGTFAIQARQRGKYLESPFTKDPEDPMYYKLWVDYWMPFYGGYGIHDACNSQDCWRTVFGNSSYRTRGSHGCINTPYNAVKFLYSWARVGTTVYIQ